MENTLELLAPLFSIVMSLAIPILLIAMYWHRKIKQNSNARDVRLSLIEHKTDAELAQVLLSNVEKNANKALNFSVLRISSTLLFGAVLLLIALSIDRHYAGLIIGCTTLGMGLGLLVAFIVEWYIKTKKTEKKA